LADRRLSAAASALWLYLVGQANLASLRLTLTNQFELVHCGALSPFGPEALTVASIQRHGIDSV